MRGVSGDDPEGGAGIGVPRPWLITTGDRATRGDSERQQATVMHKIAPILLAFMATPSDIGGQLR
jgi:hypothetical protein